ncbi:MAG TPA: dihydrolipoamide acetyltransferase family protein, partial [Myxococcota bacterium]|nr:dihydrolipoamide acetyltransferase family protein [Myxococcota bacterium]
ALQPVALPAPAPAAPPASGGIHPAVAAKLPRPPGTPTLASPAVRHEARKLGLDIETVPGSGKDGRVTREDLSTALAPAPEPRALPALQAPPPSVGDERVRIIGLRRKIAEKMVQAYRTAPHFTYVDEVDATELVALRDRLNAAAGARGTKLSYLPFIMKALAVVFKEFPTVNAVMDEEAFELVLRKDVNIGIATDTDAGLYVPVIKRVQDKSLFELAQEIADLTKRTRENKVKIDELQGGSFTITSVGNIGGRFATPILNHPEVAILGVNQIHDRPMAIDGQVVIRKMFYLSPSFDHRIIDGAVAARFVSALKALLENPQALLLDLR